MALITSMHRRLLILALAVLTALPCSLHAALPRIGQPAPALKVISLNGQPVTLESFRGQVVVLDFFATWCHPCRQSIPFLVELNRKFGKQGVQIIGLSMDEDGERALKPFASQYRIIYPLALAGDSVQVDFGIRSVPVMILIDKKGRVAEVYRGFTNEIGRSLESSVKKLLIEK